MAPRPHTRVALSAETARHRGVGRFHPHNTVAMDGVMTAARLCDRACVGPLGVESATCEATEDRNASSRCVNMFASDRPPRHLVAHGAAVRVGRERLPAVIRPPSSRQAAAEASPTPASVRGGDRGSYSGALPGVPGGRSYGVGRRRAVHVAALRRARATGLAAPAASR